MVAIKDFGMPSCCVNCDMCLPCAFNEGLCHVTQYTIGDIYDKRPSDCPLVEITCKDCKHWKDSDGVYRRGIGAESKCPVNSSRVFDGTFYCADYEKRGNENDI